MKKKKAIKIKISKTDLENFKEFEIDPYWEDLYEECIDKRHPLRSKGK